MVTDGERRYLASECREMAYREQFTAEAVANVLGLTLSGTTRYDHDAWYRLADLISPGRACSSAQRVDRERLMDLADKIDETYTSDSVSKRTFSHWADVIRESLGCEL